LFWVSEGGGVDSAFQLLCLLTHAFSQYPRAGPRVSTVHLEADWLTLDNAAKIYPTASSKSKLSPTVFRLSAMLRAPVRLSALQQASDALVRRCPYFQVYLRRGLFWYYLQRHRDTPRVQLLDRSSLESLPAGGKTGHLLRIRARGRTIAVDFSHILTDGAGGLRFFRSLLAEYLKLCGVEVEGSGDLLDPREKPDPSEAEDGHRKYFDKGGPGPTRYAAAYHISHSPPHPGYFRTLTGRLPTSQMLSLSRAAGVTITEYLAAVYMYCLSQLYEAEARSGSIPGRSILRLEVPVNMRRFFPSQTMRNFSLYVSPEADMRLGPYSFEELLSQVHRQMQMEVDRRELGRQITRNVGAELMPVIRVTPLFVKDIFLGWVYRHQTDRIYSGVLSNLGRVEVPEAMAEHIESFRMVLPPTQAMKKCCTVISYRDGLSVTISSVVESRELERLFFTTIASHGFPVAVSED
jgi:hypothetical protein